MTSFIYDALLLVYGLLTLPVLIAKGKLKDGGRERRGFLSKDALARLSAKKTIWIHAVSVGEARLAVRLVNGLLGRDPALGIVLTTTTASAMAVARQAVGNTVVTSYCPFDLSWMMRRFLEAVRPRAIVVLETEIWPNLLKLAEQKKIPLLVVNARLSDKSFPVYRSVRRLLRPAFSRITRCLAQSDEHARRFEIIGVRPDRIRVTGNMKFDLDPVPVSSANRTAMERFRAGSTGVWLAASTHPGEEEKVMDAFERVRRQIPGSRLVIAPRHLERSPAVEKIIRSKGFRCVKISESAASPEGGADILLVDEWGILNQLFACVDAVFVGGSLVPVGGHNLAEPAVAGSPVLFGPWMQNFKEMERVFCAAEAAVRVENELDLERRIVELFRDSGFREKLTARSKQAVAAHAGATDRNLEEILKWSSVN